MKSPDIRGASARRLGKRRKATPTALPPRGRQVFVAGQVGWNPRGEFESDDFVAQVEQALEQRRDRAARRRRRAANTSHA